MKNKIVVFGGSGFLGSHVADQLSDLGYNVVIYDIIKSKFLRTDQISVVGDVLDRKLIRKHVNGAKFVYHFAALADIEEAQLNPVKAIETNILSTTYIIDACREFNVERFIFGSTLYVYSEYGSFYRSTKQSSELIIENYNKIYNVNFNILRYGSLYGPRANSFNSIKKMIHQALKTKKIVREGNGEELREYIHIIDAAKITVKILDDKYVNGNLMITGKQPTRIKDILEMINEILNHKITINYTDNIPENHYNITPYTFKPKIAKKLGLELYHDLGQGILDEIYNNYESLIKEGVIKADNIFTKN